MTCRWQYLTSSWHHTHFANQLQHSCMSLFLKIKSDSSKPQSSGSLADNLDIKATCFSEAMGWIKSQKLRSPSTSAKPWTLTWADFQAEKGVWSKRSATAVSAELSMRTKAIPSLRHTPLLKYFLTSFFTAYSACDFCRADRSAGGPLRCMILCDTMWYYVILCDTMWYYVILCDTMWYYVILWYHDIMIFILPWYYDTMIPLYYDTMLLWYYDTMLWWYYDTMIL